MTDLWDYREFLLKEFHSRQNRNPAYSLRAFARDLEMPASSLSEVLSGKVGLSQARARKLGKLLQLDRSQAELFEELVVMRHSRASHSRAKAQAQVMKKLKNPTWKLEADRFEMLSDWPYLATLELCGQSRNGCAPPELEKRLGLSPTELSEIIQRLQRLGYLKTRSNGNLRATKPSTRVESATPSRAIRKFHRQILERALNSIEEQTLQERLLHSTILSINVQSLPRAYELLQEFSRKMAELARSSSAKDKKVYCLSNQFFRLEKGE